MTRFFPRPSTTETGRTTFPTGRRQREPEGRSPARMRRQGRAKRMPRQGGLRVGVGGAVQSNRHHPTHPGPSPQTPAAAQAVDGDTHRALSAPPPTGQPGSQRQAARARRAKPGANAPARQSAANAAPGRTTGGGGRGGSIKPYHPTHSRPAPQHPRQHKPNGDTRHPPPPSTRGSASPQGEARRERRRQGGAQANAAPGRITGGGGRGGAIKPYHPRHPRPAPRTPAAAQAADIDASPSSPAAAQAEKRASCGTLLPILALLKIQRRPDPLLADHLQL